jgi:hypothetical protein
MKIWVTGIVHYPDGVVLVRGSEKEKWRLPERQLDETEDIVLCIRRAVLTQTGHRTANLKFYKLHTQAKTHKTGAFLRFIFGCEVGPEPIQAPELEARHFTPDEIIRLATQDKFNDPLLLNILHRYQALIKPPERNNPFPTPSLVDD